ncbi:MAG TPA: class I SAM-dependent methyltransferase [Candidatus Methylomirabilis sp.]|nr:class I SAM-dependent methyltransferase [Candidatus Methylomirabilis sp.]
METKVTNVTRTLSCPSGEPGHVGRRVFSKGTWSFFRCGQCRHLWTDPIPTEQELAAYYDRGYFFGDPDKRGYTDYDEDKKSVAGDFQKSLDRLASLKPQRGWLLDIGAATGFFIQLARTMGWRVSGVELSNDAALIAQQRGLDVVQGTLEEHLERFRQVDVVTMWDVVEHIREPFAFFKEVRGCLAPDGLLMFGTPQGDSLFARVMGRYWTLIAPPQHIHYFSLESITRALNNAGFEIVDIEWRGKEFPLSYILHFIMGWWNVRWSWLKRLSEWKPLTKVRLRINPRDSMVVIARPARSS